MSSPQLLASDFSAVLSSRFKLSFGDIGDTPMINDTNAEFSLLNALPVLEKLDTGSFVNMFDTIENSDASKTNNTTIIENHNSPGISTMAICQTKASKDSGIYEPASSTSSEHLLVEPAKTLSPTGTSPTSTVKATDRFSATQMRYRSDTSSTNQSRESEIFSNESRNSSISTEVSTEELSGKDSDKENPNQSPKLKWLLGDDAPVVISPVAQQIPRRKHLGRDKPLPLPPAAASGAPSQLSRMNMNEHIPLNDGKSNSLPCRRIKVDFANPNEATYETRQDRWGSNSLIRTLTTKSAKQISSTKIHVSALLDPSLAPSRKAGTAVCRSEKIVLTILQHVHSVTDLQNTAMTNTIFYQTYRRNEVTLVSSALRKTSIAAWELRQSVEHSVKPSPFRMKSLQRDIATIRALESFMIMNCRTVCRHETISALLDHNLERKRELEDAIWRIWTFCKLFGKGATPTYGFSKQVSWLNGTFDPHPRKKHKNSVGTRSERALTAAQLEDMSEMWRCMELLLNGFRGQEKAARRAGLFSRCIITEEITESGLLNTWIHDILSLGPKAVLTLVSCDFEQAKVLGVTRWTPPMNSKGRDSFLRGAIEEVYRELLVADAQRKAATFKRTYTVSHSHHRSVSDSVIQRVTPSTNGPPLPPKELRLDTDFITRRKPVQSWSAQPDGHLEIRPDCDPLSAISPINNIPSAPPITNATPFSMLSLNPNVSTRLGPSLFPENDKRKPQMCEPQPLPVVNLPDPSVVDPSDRALDLLVHGMRYPEVSARRALAMSDSGSGINLQRAIEFLTSNFKSLGKNSLSQMQIAELPGNMNDHSTPEAKPMSQEEFCEGSCKSLTLLPTRPKGRPQSIALLKRGKSLTARMSMRKSSALSVILDDEEQTIKSISENEETTSGDELPQVANQDTFRSNGGGNRVSILSTKNRYSKGVTSDLSWRRSILSPDLIHKMTGHSFDTQPSQSTLLPNNADMSHTPVSPLSPNTFMNCAVVEGRSSDESSTSSFEVPTSLACMPTASMSLQKPRVTLLRVGTARSSSVMSWRMGSRREKANKRRDSGTGEVIGYAY